LKQQYCILVINGELIENQIMRGGKIVQDIGTGIILAIILDVGMIESWPVTQGLILSCTYMPVIIGVSSIILSITLSTVLFINWMNKSN
jgi:hypothetical protein